VGSVSPEIFAGVVPFVVIAQLGSFRNAAKKLGMTTSAVSKAMRKLESDLGVRLLHRTSRRVTLTAEGAEFLQSCSQAVDQVRIARDLVSHSKETPRGVLRVSLPPTFARSVTAALPRLLAEYPELSIHAIVTNRFLQLTEENVDVAIRIGALEDSSYVCQRLCTLDLITAAAPSYLTRNGTPRTPVELAKHNCLKLVLDNGIPQKWVFRINGKATSVPTPGNFSSDEGDQILTAAVAGLGLIQAPDVMLRDEIESGLLVKVLTRHATAGPPLTLLSAPGRKDLAKVRVFTQLMRELVTKARPSRGAPRSRKS
jgi:LysR family transcriptional regulator, regulator for bpeEF and oprC